MEAVLSLNKFVIIFIGTNIIHNLKDNIMLFFVFTEHNFVKKNSIVWIPKIKVVAIRGECQFLTSKTCYKCNTRIIYQRPLKRTIFEHEPSLQT